MDALKAEIAARKKRKAEADRSPQPGVSYEASGSSTAAASSSDAPGASTNKQGEEVEKRYVRRREVEREEEETRRRREMEEKERKEREAEQERSKRIKKEDDEATRPSAIPFTSKKSMAEEAAAAAISTARKEAFNISPLEAVQRLRAKGQPIRLFAESDKERRLRLRALELIEERGQRVGQNDFMKALQGAESGIALEELERGGRKVEDKGNEKGDKKGNETDAADSTAASNGEKTGKTDERESRPGVGMDSLLDLNLIRTDIHKVYPIIYYTLKQLLNDWETALSQRPTEVKSTTQGKLVAATQRQTADYLKPLFKKLRQRQLEPDVLMRIAEIVHFMQKREYRHANDSYLQLSIGNAPWPIGVTMVGIHERSGREKIFSSNVAHVLNDEVSRKYIQSLKRLMTFAQTKWPPTNLAMLMG